MGSHTETVRIQMSLSSIFNVGTWSDMHYCHYMFKVVKPIARRQRHVHEDLDCFINRFDDDASVAKKKHVQTNIASFVSDATVSHGLHS